MTVPTQTPLPLVPPGRALVVGLGVSGLSALRHLLRLDVDVEVMDSRAQPPGVSEALTLIDASRVHVGGFDADVMARADYLVLSPGVARALPEIRGVIESGRPVLGDIELFARWQLRADAALAVITGSNGKSTVTTLLGEMARLDGRRVAVGGNLGTPALDLVGEDPGLYILELSSFQLESTGSLQPRVATVLNLSADHMDRYPDLAAYAAAKSVALDQAACAVVNRDDGLVASMRGGSQRLSFGFSEPNGMSQFGLRDDDGRQWLARGDELLMPADEMLLPGRHNLANALAALAMGSELGLSLEAMRKALRGFGGLPHRTQVVARHDEITWINDSKGTNVGATVAALEGLDQGDETRTLLIAGGDCKDADFTPLAEVAARYLRHLILLGRDASRIEAAVAGQVPSILVGDMDQAVRLAKRLARSGDRVLLSPACASFDMFSGYAERGVIFTQAVKEALT